MRATWTNAVIFFPLAALAAVVGGRPFAPDNDVFFHLSEGRRILETAALPRTDVYSYTAAGAPNECLHSWLSQVAMWKVFAASGETGLRALGLFLLLVPLVLGFRHIRRGGTGPGVAALFGFLFVLLQSRILVLRPLLFGEAMFAIVTLGLLAETETISPKRATAIAAIAALWANLHGSVVVLPVVLAVFAAAHAWNAGRAADRLTITSPLWGALAASISPLGPAIFRTAVSVSSTGGATIGNEEWDAVLPLKWEEAFPPPGRLSLALDGVSLLFMAGAAASVWLLARAARGERAVRFPALLSVVCVALCATSFRHALYLVYPIAAAGRAIGDGPWLARLRPQVRELFVGYAGLALLFFLRFHVSPDVAPGIARAVDFLAEAGIEGALANPPGWGAYLEYRLYPRVKVSADSRTVVHQSFYRMERALYERYGERSMNILLGSLPPETTLVAVPVFSIPPSLLLPPSQWALVFENNTASILMRRVPANEDNFRRVEAYYNARKIPFDAKEGFSAAAALQASPGWFVKHYEMSPWGAWPSRLQRADWSRRESVFYQSRKLAGASLGEDIRR